MTARPQDVALLPCPFCGGPGKLYDSEAGRDGLPRTYRDAGCTQCFLRFGYAPAHEAAAMWNRRSDAALASAQAREEELRTALDMIEGIATGSRTVNSLPHIQKIAAEALSTNAATQTGETT